MIYTTFNLARRAGACELSYKRYARHVGGIRKYGRHTPIPLVNVLDVLGLAVEDALWCLDRAAECDDGRAVAAVKRLLACDYAEHVLYVYEREYPDDRRPRTMIEVSRCYTRGEASEDELAAARAASWEAVEAAWAAARVHYLNGGEV